MLRKQPGNVGDRILVGEIRSCAALPGSSRSSARQVTRQIEPRLRVGLVWDTSPTRKRGRVTHGLRTGMRANPLSPNQNKINQHMKRWIRDHSLHAEEHAG